MARCAADTAGSAAQRVNLFQKCETSGASIPTRRTVVFMPPAMTWMVSPSVTRVTSYCPANEEAGFTKRKARMARNRTDLRIWQILIKCNPSALLSADCQKTLAADISNAETLERETRALVEAGRTVKGAELLLLLNLSEESSITRDGFTIEVLPAWKWLLDYKA